MSWEIRRQADKAASEGCHHTDTPSPAAASSTPAPASDIVTALGMPCANVDRGGGAAPATTIVRASASEDICSNQCCYGTAFLMPFAIRPIWRSLHRLAFTKACDGKIAIMVAISVLDEV
jgi:hypothetical protein